MSMQEAISAARGAGFEGDGLVEIVAISGRESNWDASKTADTRLYSERRDDGRWYIPGTDSALPAGVGPEYSVGPLQLNLTAHPEIAEWEARWWPTAFAYGFQLSKRGADFQDWSTFRLVTEDDRAAVRSVLAQPVTAAQGFHPYDPQTDLDAIHSTQLVEAMWQLVASGAGARIEPVEGSDEIIAGFVTTWDALLAVKPELGDLRP